MSRFAHRVAALAVLAAVLLTAGATRAAAHPLGNFTVNTYSGLRVGPDRLEVDYVLDMAEIPSFQARQAVDTDHNGTITATEATAWRVRECPRLARDLRATADGRALTLTVTGSALRFPKGAAGLETLRLECALTAPLPAPRRRVAPSPTPTTPSRAGSAGTRSPPSATAPPSTPPTFPPAAPAPASPPTQRTSSAPPSTSAPPPSTFTLPDRRARTRPPAATPPGGGR